MRISAFQDTYFSPTGFFFLRKLLHPSFFFVHELAPRAFFFGGFYKVEFSITAHLHVYVLGKIPSQTFTLSDIIFAMMIIIFEQSKSYQHNGDHFISRITLSKIFLISLLGFL
jgi:hypothetical protein